MIENDINDDVDLLKEDYLGRLKEIHSRLLTKVGKVESAIRAIQGEHPVLENAETPYLSEADKERLENGSWKDVAQWGLSQFQQAVTLTELVNHLAQLPINRIQQRTINNTLHNVLRLHIEVMVRDEQVIKIENSKRKGGIMYQLNS